MPPNVRFVRPEVVKRMPTWEMVADCLEGSAAVKDKRDDYLPIPNAADRSRENMLRYDAYLLRAQFYAVTSRTLDGLLGEVFRYAPEVELPAQLALLEDDADGEGVGLVQSARRALAHILSFGCCGVLCDYPANQGPLTVAQAEGGSVRPTIRNVLPSNVINWRTRRIGARNVLSLVVIREVVHRETINVFELVTEERYRVLSLDESNLYKVQIYEDSGKDGFQLSEEYRPTDSAGQRFNAIPFSFIGSVDNNATLDAAPLAGIAELNIGHYRNSADAEHTAYMVGQPTVIASGLTEHWYENVLGKKLEIGSNAVIALNQGASAQLLQASPNQLPSQEMALKEARMIQLGAKLMERQRVERTLGEARIDEAAESSVLTTCASNVSEAYTRMLGFASRFAGGKGEASITLNTDLDVGFLSAPELTALAALWVQGAITFAEMRGKLRKTGIATEDDAVAEAARIAAQEEAIEVASATMEATAPAEPENDNASKSKSKEA